MGQLSVREIQHPDIDLIADYWLESDAEFLINMGVDLNKLPTREDLRIMLSEQILAPIEDKKSYALIWELSGKQIGHCNVNEIDFGNEAYMHLHLWRSNIRRKGIGTELVVKSLPYFFNNLKLRKVISEPYALNPAPNKMLEKIGFEFEKRYSTIPGSLSFEQKANRWKLTREKYEEITLVLPPDSQ